MNKSDHTKDHEKLLRQCLLELTTIGFMVWNNRSGAVKTANRYQSYGIKGSSDIIGVMTNGSFIAIEIKTGKAIQTKYQKNFQKALEARNGIYKIIRTYEGLIEWIKQLQLP